MKENLRDIKPGIGLGDLIFGMKKEQVRVVLGEPDEIETQSFEDDCNDSIEIWHYDEYELSVSFSEEDNWKLYTISVNAEFYMFNRETVINTDYKKMKANLLEWNFTDLEFEDASSSDNPNHKLISSDSTGIYFWFDDNKLTEIQWSPLFKGVDEVDIDWPAIPS